MSPSGWALSWALVALYAAPVFFVVYLLDLYEREPLSLVIGAFLWGAVAATTLAGLANEGWGLVVSRLGGPEFASRWTAALTAPLTEEILKGAGVVMIALIATEEIDDELDGFVYGAICGLGFAVVEDVVYLVAVFGGTTSGVLAGFYVRVISSGLYGHVLYTGLVGIGVAYVVSRRGELPLRRRVLVALGLFAVAAAGHFLWDSPLLDLFPNRVRTVSDFLQIPFAAAVKGAPLLAFVLVLVHLARRRERRWLREALAPEVGGPAVSAEEVGILLDPHARRRSRRAMRARAGDRAAKLLKRLQREQITLAMIRARVGPSSEDPALVRQREYCRSLRDALAAMPGAAPAVRSAG
jgi:protease PrsW